MLSWQEVAAVLLDSPAPLPPSALRQLPLVLFECVSEREGVNTEEEEEGGGVREEQVIHTVNTLLCTVTTQQNRERAVNDSVSTHKNPSSAERHARRRRPAAHALPRTA